MPDPLHTPPTTRKRRGWFRRTLRLSLWLLLIVLIFHRPIVQHGGRWLVIWFAKKQHLTLDFRITGNLWNHLGVGDVRISSDGTGPAPIEHLSLDYAELRYSILQLIRGDFGGLQTIRLGTLDATITPLPAKPKPPDKKPSPPLAEQIRKLLTKPLPGTVIEIQRVNFRVLQPSGEIAVRGFTIRKDGTIGIEAMRIPGIDELHSIQGLLSLKPSGLTLQELAVLPDLFTVRHFGVRPATLTEPPHFVLEAGLGTGALRLTASPRQQGEALQVEAAIEDVALAPLAKRFGVKLPVEPDIRSLEMSALIVPENPERMNVRIVASTQTKLLEPPWILDSRCIARLENGLLAVEELYTRSDAFTFRAQGEFQCSDVLAKRAPFPFGTLKIALQAPDLSNIQLNTALGLRGKADMEGTIRINNGVLQADSHLEIEGLGIAGVEVQSLELRHTLTHRLLEPGLLDSLTANASAALNGITIQSAQIDNFTLRANLQNRQLEITELMATRGVNRLEAKASAALENDGRLVGKPNVHLKLRAPELHQFAVPIQQSFLHGAVEADADLIINAMQKPPVFDGIFKLQGRGFRLEQTELGALDFQVSLSDGRAHIQKGEIIIGAPPLAGMSDSRVALNLNGETQLAAPFTYEAKMRIQADKLSVLTPILAAIGIHEPIAGSLKADWQGRGDAQAPRGEARLSANALQLGKTIIDSVNLSLRHSPAGVELDDFFAKAQNLQVLLRAAWKPERVAVPKLELRIGEQSVLVGTADIPLDANARFPIARNQPLEIDLDTKRLDFAEIFQALNQSPPIQGSLALTAKARGTLTQPTLNINLDAAKLTLPPREGLPRIEPTDLTCRILYNGNNATLSGTIRNADVQPLRLEAEAPLALPALLDGKMPDFANLPIKARATLPPSTLAFIRKLTPAVERIEGNAALNLALYGTLAKPRLDGSVNISAEMLRLSGGAAPPLSNLAIRVGLRGDTITFNQFSGELGGGRFSLGGAIGLADLAKPQLGLTLAAKEVLVLRDDGIVVRADVDASLRGPIDRATATGTVWVTQSRFTKEVDILPLSLPGKPKPTPRSVNQPKVISFPKPPLRDWSFDIALKTRPGDPFRVRGNLAKGEVSLNLRLAGTGLAPYLVGAASIDRFQAVLPVSTLKTRRGMVIFTEDRPFDPRVEIEAETVVRQNTIVARINGPTTGPRLDLESEPPLPQQEILSLMTTGSLSGEVGANNAAMATRAALLVVKGWYKKLFKRDLPAESDDGGESLLDRFELELGNMDPKTGRQEMSAQFRATDHLFFIGDLEMGGGFTGRMKYLIRFR